MQGQYTKLSTRIDTMYIDKLDGNITAEFFEEKSREWKKEQEDIMDKIQKHQKANHIYITEGVKLLELAQNAHRLYIKQDANEKRKLLNFVVSNSVWDGKNLKAEFKQPFDMLVKSKVKIESEITFDMPKMAIFEKWLPILDTIRKDYFKDIMIMKSILPGYQSSILLSPNSLSAC